MVPDTAPPALTTATEDATLEAIEATSVPVPDNAMGTRCAFQIGAKPTKRSGALMRRLETRSSNLETLNGSRLGREATQRWQEAVGLAPALRCKIPFSECDFLQDRRLHSKDIRAPNWPHPAAYKRQALATLLTLRAHFT